MATKIRRRITIKLDELNQFTWPKERLELLEQRLEIIRSVYGRTKNDNYLICLEAGIEYLLRFEIQKDLVAISKQEE